jgi:hypothetical protein
MLRLLAYDGRIIEFVLYSVNAKVEHPAGKDYNEISNGFIFEVRSSLDSTSLNTSFQKSLHNRAAFPKNKTSCLLNR